jgi:hypothetical protein
MRQLASLIRSPSCTRIWEESERVFFYYYYSCSSTDQTEIEPKIKGGKYVLFVIPIDFDPRLTQDFARRAGNKECDQTKVDWVPLHLLLDGLQKNERDFFFRQKQNRWSRYFLQILSHPSCIEFLRSLSLAPNK